MNTNINSPGRSERMRKTLAVLAAITLLALTGCSNNPDPASADSSTTDDVAASNSTAATLPNLVGKGLQAAQDKAQAAGFYDLSSHDALGRSRHQVLDRDWQVCTQTPVPGTHSEDTTVDFGVVKLDETCPANDAGTAPVTAAGATMPNLIGKSGSVAEQALGSNASISWVDGTGGDRVVIVTSNWQICKQSPKSGQEFDGVPVRLTVVKFGERC